MSHITGMDTSGLPVPDAIPLITKLEEDLVLEVKFQPNLRQLPVTTQVRIFCVRQLAKERNCIKILLHALSVELFLLWLNLIVFFLNGKYNEREREIF